MIIEQNILKNENMKIAISNDIKIDLFKRSKIIKYYAMVAHA